LPEIVEACAAQETDEFVVDGEIVAFERGWTNSPAAAMPTPPLSTAGCSLPRCCLCHGVSQGIRG
jgi:hypothetical protein